jgi:hypothetical protein
MTPDDILQTTFRCATYGLIPVRGCLRRQLDQDATQEAPRPARRPACAGGCAVGYARLLEAQDAGVALSACPGCGDALIGIYPATCPTCAARRVEAGEEVPRGFLADPRAVSVAMASSRIWTGEAPDLPLPGPPAARPALPPVLRPAHRPTHRETPMPRPAKPKPQKPEPRTCSTPGCGAKIRSDNSKGLCSPCQRTTIMRKRRAVAAGREAKPLTKVRAETREEALQRMERTVAAFPSARPQPALATDSLSTAAFAGMVRDTSTPNLLGWRAELDEELRRRLAVAQDEIVALKAAVGAAEAA